MYTRFRDHGEEPPLHLFGQIKRVVREWLDGGYVKNQGMQFDVPYRAGSTPRKYVPDFIVRVDDGREDLLNLVLETKGYGRCGASPEALHRAAPVNFKFLIWN